MKRSTEFDRVRRHGGVLPLCALILAACSSSENAAAPSSAGGAAGSSGSSGSSGVSGSSGASQGGAGATGAGGGTSAGGTGAGGAPASGASVLMHHKNPTRDGMYVDAAFTKANAAKLHLDATFKATLSGPTYAQPLYFAGGPGGKDLVIAATEQNQVSAFDAATGAVVWQKTLAPPATRGDLPCGNISPMGVTGTPAIDAASRTLIVAAMTMDSGSPKQKVYGLSIDDGSTKTGWPVDVSATAKANGVAFDSPVQGERGALLVMNGTVYVPYGGHYGDCGDYHGWVVGISVANPGPTPIAWATRARAGGIWASGGVSSDGQSLYLATGNTFGASTWGDGEAVFRLGTNLAATQATADYFAPTNWSQLDSGDVDLGGSGPVIFDVPGATPSKLLMALGKDGNAYLLDRTSLGGIGTALATLHASRDRIINAEAAYRTSQASYVVFKGAGMGCPGGTSGTLTALKIAASSPPALSVAWCAGGAGSGSPMVTTTNGTANAIVWWIAAEGDGKIHGFDGDTGAVVFDGGADALSGVARFSTPIAVNGRLFAATSSSVAAFTMN